MAAHPPNLPASIHQRLLNHAKEQGRPLQELLQYFAIERFLFRLSQSPHATRFYLKGALMLRLWDAPLSRPTIDVDLLGQQVLSQDELEQVIKDIRRATRKQYGAEEKIRIVLEGLRGEESIAALCRREGIAESLYYNWSKEFLEAGKKRLAGDTARAATSDEVKVLRKEARDLKEVVAEQALELRILKKSMIADGGDDE